MKPRVSHQKTAALTLVEVVFVTIVIASLFVLATLFLPRLQHPRHGIDPQSAQCIGNLGQISLAYLVWAGDHNGKFPMQIPVADGGTMGLSNLTNAWLNFLVLSNELSTPKILRCPADKDHVVAKGFSISFSGKNISYFVGLDANTNNPKMLLSGDDNFAIGGIPVKSGLLEISTNASVAWTGERHENVGNLLLADGGIRQTSIRSLQQSLVETSVATNRLAIP